MKTEKDIILNVPEDCDNAPKRRFVRDFVVALFKRDLRMISEKLAEGFTFKIIGNRSVVTIDDLEKHLNTYDNAIELTIDKILSHGKYAACNGLVKSKKEEISFAYFFEFKSAGNNTLKTISEYRISDQ